MQPHPAIPGQILHTVRRDRVDSLGGALPTRCEWSR
jgi:hypothetical protein